MTPSFVAPDVIGGPYGSLFFPWIPVFTGMAGKKETGMVKVRGLAISRELSKYIGSICIVNDGRIFQPDASACKAVGIWRH